MIFSSSSGVLHSCGLAHARTPFFPLSVVVGKSPIGVDPKPRNVVEFTGGPVADLTSAQYNR